MMYIIVCCPFLPDIISALEHITSRVLLAERVLLVVHCQLGEVVAQLVECSPINLLACASVGSNPVTATLCP